MRWREKGDGEAERKRQKKKMIKIQYLLSNVTFHLLLGGGGGGGRGNSSMTTTIFLPGHLNHQIRPGQSSPFLETETSQESTTSQSL